MVPVPSPTRESSELATGAKCLSRASEAEFYGFENAARQSGPEPATTLDFPAKLTGVF